MYEIRTNTIAPKPIKVSGSLEFELTGQPQTRVYISAVDLPTTEHADGRQALAVGDVEKLAKYYAGERSRLTGKRIPRAIVTTSKDAHKNLQTARDTKSLIFIDGKKINPRTMGDVEFSLLRMQYTVYSATDAALVATDLVRQVPKKHTLEQAKELFVSSMSFKLGIDHKLTFDNAWKQSLKSIISTCSVSRDAKNIKWLPASEHIFYKRAIKEGGVYVDSSQMAVGKTMHNMIPGFNLSCKINGTKTAYLVCKKILAAQICGDNRHYHKMESGTEFDEKGFCGVINSMIKPKFASFTRAGTLFVDEMTELVSHMAGDSCGRNLTERQQIIDVFEEMIRNARTIIIADAHFNDHTLAYIRKIRGEEETITIAYDKPNYDSNVDWFHSNDFGQAITMIRKDLAANKKVVVFTDNKVDEIKAFVRSMTEDIDKEIRSITVTKSIYREKGGEELMSDLDGQLPKYDLVAFTPVVGSGLNIKTDAFDRGYLLTTGTLPPIQLIQTIMRFRALKNWTVAFKINDIAYQTDELMLKMRAIVKATDGPRFANIIGETAADFVAKQKAFDNAAKNDCVNSTILLMTYMGFNLTRIETDKCAKKAGNAKHKEKVEDQKVKDREFKKSVNTDIGPEKLKLLLDDSKPNTYDENLLLAAIDLKKVFGIETITEEAVVFDKEGEGRPSQSPRWAS